MRLAWTLIALSLLVTPLALLTVHHVVPPMGGGPSDRRLKSQDNIKSMITLMLVRRVSRDGWPQYDGRNFILSLVATRQLDARKATNLELLWPPSMLDRFLELDVSEYKKVTKKSLRTRRFPHLTGYAGRRNTDEDAVVTREQEAAGTPLIADLTHPDGVIFGFSSGAVRFMTWAELDMKPPEGPVVVGPMASNPLLRLLSNE